MAAYLADTSAWNRSNTNPSIAERWSDLVLQGDVAICPPVALELFFSIRSPREYAALDFELSSLPSLPLDQRAAAAAIRSQAALAARSQHRGPKPIDLLIAAIAEANGAILIHYDRHFDAIARVTGQPMQWLARPGSLP